jgi:ABC-type transport system involved in cytochrome bd biosynthesis fused ATPase/permease subunit
MFHSPYLVSRQFLFLLSTRYIFILFHTTLWGCFIVLLLCPELFYSTVTYFLQDYHLCFSSRKNFMSFQTLNDTPPPRNCTLFQNTLFRVVPIDYLIKHFSILFPLRERLQCTGYLFFDLFS